MASKRIKFTKSIIENITPPKQQKNSTGSVYDIYKDEKEEGLILLVTSAGSRTFYLYKKINTRPEKIKIGKFPDLSIENARKQAQIIKAEIAQGINPKDEIRKLKSEITFKELFDRYINNHAKYNNKSWKEDIEDINRNLKHWLNKKISKITKEEILKIFQEKSVKKYVEGTKIPRGGKGGANRLLDRISAIFNKAVEWNMLEKNPASGIKKHKIKSRDRFLTESEMPRFFDALRNCTNQDLQDYVYISLYTGARKENIVSMQWKDLDLKNATWLIPVTKNDTSQLVHLHLDLIEILKRKRKLQGNNSKFVFASHSKKGHVLSFKKGWANLIRSADIENFRIHDMRRTLGSMQAILGASEIIIGKSLNHKSRQATAVYSRLTNDPVKQSMFSAIEYMKENASQETI